MDWNCWFHGEIGMYRKYKRIAIEIFIPITTKMAWRNNEKDKPSVKDLHRILGVKKKKAVKIEQATRWNGGWTWYIILGSCSFYWLVG